MYTLLFFIFDIIHLKNQCFVGYHNSIMNFDVLTKRITYNDTVCDNEIRVQVS